MEEQWDLGVSPIQWGWGLGRRSFVFRNVELLCILDSGARRWYSNCNDDVHGKLTSAHKCVVNRLVIPIFYYCMSSLKPVAHGEIQESLANARYRRATAVCVWRLFCHLTVVWRPLAEERRVISTQSIHRWKLRLVGYNSVANIRVTYFHSFNGYCLRNTRNVAKFQENLTLQQFKVIQGHRIGVNGKPIFLLVIY